MGKYNWDLCSSSSGGGSTVDLDNQTLSLSGSVLQISGGNSVDLSALPCNCPTPTGAETIVTAGTNTTVTGAGTAANPYVVSATDKDAQALTLSGTVLQISGGNSVDLAALPCNCDGSETVVQAGTNTTVTGSGTAADPYIVNAAGGGGSTVAVSNTTTGHRVGTITVDGVAVDINETVTSLGTPTWDSVTGLFSISYVDENGVTQTRTTYINPTFVNTDAQQLTGDNTGTVKLTLTPVTQPDGSINYTVKADLPLATTVPSGGTNLLKYDAARGGWYVDSTPPATAIGEMYVVALGTVQTYGGLSNAKLNFTRDVAHTFDATVGPQISKSGNGLLLKAGYKYRIQASINAQTNSTNSWTTYRLQVNGANVTTTAHYHSNTYNNESVTSTTREYVIEATTDTLIEIKNVNGTSAANFQFNAESQLSAQVLAKI